MTPLNLPQLMCLDRDGTLCSSSSNPDSPLYYITSLDHIVVKPGAEAALRLIRAHSIPTILVTKQRCISKGLVSREQVDLVNVRLQRMLNHTFVEVLVEEDEETKKRLYAQVLAKYRDLNPARIHLFDDSEVECTVAARMGITSHDGSDLWAAINRVLECR